MASTSAPRLLDLDPAKYRSTKEVIVVGRPGTGTDAVAEALRILNFKVYDFKTAVDRHDRDFPLWVEAAQLRKQGKPYDSLDYDKIIGNHNALVGAPTCFFDAEFIKLYPHVKIIMMTKQPDQESLKPLLQNLNKFAVKQVLRRIDPVFFGNISSFLEMAGGTELDHQAIRDTVRPGNLLEIEELGNDWTTICEFLKVKVPTEPLPALHDDTTAIELAERPLKFLNQMVKLHGMKVVRGLQTLCAAAGVSLSANLIVGNARGSAVIGFGVVALISAWYWMGRATPNTHEPEPIIKPSNGREPVCSNNSNAIIASKAAYEEPGRGEKNNSRRNQGRPGRGRQPDRGRQPARSQAADTGPRRERPLLAGWGNTEAMIHADDIVQYHGRMEQARAFEGKDVVYNETRSGRNAD
ncbi:hypothetical protein NX059_001505 [Plenodomus lindquistii]|nr:hypothetical protein NX059_001505 [Plenodomus lindquistii]